MPENGNLTRLNGIWNIQKKTVFRLFFQQTYKKVTNRVISSPRIKSQGRSNQQLTTAAFPDYFYYKIHLNLTKFLLVSLHSCLTNCVRRTEGLNILQHSQLHSIKKFFQRYWSTWILTLSKIFEVWKAILELHIFIHV